MSGNGVAGITVSLLRVVTKAAVSGPNSANLSAILYFSLSAAVILGCILCYAFVLEVRAPPPRQGPAPAPCCNTHWLVCT